MNPMWKHLEGEIVTVITTAGEVVGRLKKADFDNIVVQDPRLVAVGSQGVGLAGSVGYSAKQGLSECTFCNAGVATIVPTADEIAAGWVKATSGIQLAL